MRPPSNRALAIPLAACLALLLPFGEIAFPLSNCTLELTSRDAAGSPIDTATGGTDDATQSDPLQVDWDGTVDWTGTMGSQVIRDHTWHVDVFGIPTPLRGGDPNEDGETGSSDTVSVGANAPFRFTGLFYVSGEITGTGGSCSGNGWLRVRGDPVGTVPFFVALAVAAIGAVLLAMGARGSWMAAVSGGLLLGLAVAVLLVIFATLPLGAPTPLVVVVMGLLAGIATGWFGRRPAPVA